MPGFKNSRGASPDTETVLFAPFHVLPIGFSLNAAMFEQSTGLFAISAAGQSVSASVPNGTLAETSPPGPGFTLAAEAQNH